MTLKTLAMAFLSGMGCLATAASLTAAHALPGVAPAAAAQVASEAAPVELAHGCHRGIQRDNRGWHFHTGACVRRNTAPPGLHDYYANRRYYRAPLCRYTCKHVGPVKTCSQVCR